MTSSDVRCLDSWGHDLSAAIQYPTDEIVVIPNRDELTAFEGFLETDLASEKVARMFRYRPNGAPTLASFVSARRLEPKPLLRNKRSERISFAEVVPKSSSRRLPPISSKPVSG